LAELHDIGTEELIRQRWPEKQDEAALAEHPGGA